MGEFRPVIPETTKNNQETVESQRMALIEAFVKNESKIGDIAESDDEYYIPHDKLIVDEDIHTNFPVMDERVKLIIQQNRKWKPAENSNDLRQKNKDILRQLADLNDNKTSDFVLDEIRKNGD